MRGAEVLVMNNAQEEKTPFNGVLTINFLKGEFHWSIDTILKREKGSHQSYLEACKQALRQWEQWK